MTKVVVSMDNTQYRVLVSGHSNYDVKGKGLIFEDTGERLKDFYPERFYEKLET